MNLKNREIWGNGKHCRMWVWKTRNGCKRYLKSLNKTYLKKVGKRPKTSSEIWTIGRRNEHELNWKYPMLECGNTGTDLNRALMQSKGMSDERIVKWTWTKSKKHPMLEFRNTGTDLSRPLKAFSRPARVAQWRACRTPDLVVASSIPGLGDFSFRRIFASHLCRSMWEK